VVSGGPPRDDAPKVRSDANEPAVTGGETVVPEVAAWQRAADAGAARGVGAAGGRGAGPPWIPASARIPAPVRDELVEWLDAARPNEGWGVLVAARMAEDGGVPERFIGMRNAAESPYRYYPEPEELLRVMLEIDDADEVVWGVVHSHVASAPVPSATDVGLATYPDAVYVIASFATEKPELRAWTIVAGAVNEVGLERT